MTAPDPFLHYDGAYALGTLDPDDRAAFESHLPGCADCRARVADMQQTAALLRGITADDVTAPADGPPAELLPSLVRRAARERTRRRVLVGTLAGVAAAALAALLIVVWPGGDGAGGGGAGTSSAQAFRPVSDSVPLRAEAVLSSRQWGTRIDVSCRYELEPLRPIAYRLVIVSTDSRRHDAGSWKVAPGTTTFVGGTEVPRNRIAQVQITRDDGRAIMILQP